MDPLQTFIEARKKKVLKTKPLTIGFKRLVFE
jgi:hypothetical protein